DRETDDATSASPTASERLEEVDLVESLLRIRRGERGVSVGQCPFSVEVRQIGDAPEAVEIGGLARRPGGRVAGQPQSVVALDLVGISRKAGLGFTQGPQQRT